MTEVFHLDRSMNGRQYKPLSLRRRKNKRVSFDLCQNIVHVFEGHPNLNGGGVRLDTSSEMVDRILTWPKLSEEEKDKIWEAFRKAKEQKEIEALEALKKVEEQKKELEEMEALEREEELSMNQDEMEEGHYDELNEEGQNEMEEDQYDELEEGEILE